MLRVYVYYDKVFQKVLCTPSGVKTAHDRHLARSSLINSSGIICMRTKHFA